MTDPQFPNWPSRWLRYPTYITLTIFLWGKLLVYYVPFREEVGFPLAPLILGMVFGATPMVSIAIACVFFMALGYERS